MSIHRFAARRDKAEPAVRQALERLGWTVENLSIEDGPDLLLGKRGQTHTAEVKTGAKKLRPGQAKWHAEWRGAAVAVLRTPEDAIRFDAAIFDLADAA